MLESLKKVLRLAGKALPAVFFVLVLGLSAAAFCWNAERVFFGDAVYFADGDSYARMTRVRLLQHAPLTPIREHRFENFPEGTLPHTTAPLDYVLLALTTALRPFVVNPMSLAGAIVSPFLGLVTLCFLAVWCRMLRLPFWWAVVILAGLSPMSAQGFLLGRPDHQSLVVLLLAVALGSELALWRRAGGAWPFVSAAAWGLALWVSLFEPLILLAVVLIARAIYLGKDALPRRPRPLVLFGAIIGLALSWDGLRTSPVDQHFGRWAQTIGELQHANSATLLSWTGWLLAAVPLLLLFRIVRTRNGEAAFWLALCVLLTGLSLVHARWGYFLVLVIAMSLPWALAVFRRKWIAGLAFAAALWPVAAGWDQTLYPDQSTFESRAEEVADAVLLRDAASRLRSLPPGGVMAPWWLCPAIVWWSGLPCIGGTSHQALPGTVESAKFYLSTDENAARDILRRHRIRYVFAYEPDRILTNSAAILGVERSAGALGGIIFNHPALAPSWLHPRYANKFFRIYEVSADFEN